MLLFVALVARLAFADPAILAQPLPEIMSFSEWRAHFEKVGTLTSQSSGKTLEEREDQFNRNIEKIKKQNSLNDAGLSGFRFGVNQFADLTPDEFAAEVGLGGYKRTAPRNNVWLNTTAASSIDWRTRNAVTPVKNQGQCGSCWSFSSTGAIEGAVAVGAGQLISLSEKQLMDCSKKNSACQGGLMDLAFEYVISNGGLTTEANYPYQPVDGSCQTSLERMHAVTISGYNDVTPNNAEQLQAAASQQPISIAIEADKEVFQLYTGGVLDSAQCGTQLDHGVLIVGFTETNDRTYPNAWIVKNSWGPTWGVQGFIYISRSTRYSAAGVCGILSDPSYPTGGSAGPAPSPGPSPPPAPSSSDYENPFLVKGCKGGEVNITIGDPSGSICAPVCNGPTDMNCPAAPTGFTATPGCNLVDSMINYHFCSLTCQPYSSNNGGCGAGSTCDIVCTASKCTWQCLFHLTHEEGLESNTTIPRPDKEKVGCPYGACCNGDCSCCPAGGSCDHCSKTSGIDRLHKLEYSDK